MRRGLTVAALAAVLLATAGPSAAASKDVSNWDGLVEVNSRKMDAAFLLPGADFRPYSKVMLDQPEVAFRKDWMRNMNQGMGSRVTEKEAKEILATVQTNTADIFTEAFTKAGYTVVTEAGENVLRISSGVINLYVNAPDTQSSAFTRTFTANAGEATLVLELRDSLTNALLGRVLDRREAQGMPGSSNSVTNLAEFRQLAGQWAKIGVKGLDALREHSPVPEPLTPGQKLN